MTPKSIMLRPGQLAAPTPAAAAPAALGAPRVIDSAELLGPQGEVLIDHEGRVYRLRRTRLGKLILTA
jgi:hemin uptake protein HemP